MGTLLVDLGNTRAKFAWVARAAAPRTEWRVWSAHSEQEFLPDDLPPNAIEAAWICSVGRPEKADLVERELLGRHPPVQLRRFRSSAMVAGIRNRYVTPERLGADRLAAALGARSHVASGSIVIATFGTATTIDRLDADDAFDGGVILPGMGMMARALAQGTAALPVIAPGLHAGAAWPRETGGAIAEGILRAQLGALDRCLALDPGAALLLSGGDASVIAARLDRAHRVVDNLVLDGLARVAFAPQSPDRIR